MQVTLEIRGLKETQQNLLRVKKAMSPRPTVFSQIGRRLTSFFSGEVYASRGGIIGEPWPRLSDAYAAWKARKFPGAIPLVRTGRMIRSYRYQSGPGFVRLYNPTRYFGYHQSSAPRTKIPRRVTMKIDAGRRREIGLIVAENVRQEIARGR